MRPSIISRQQDSSIAPEARTSSAPPKLPGREESPEQRQKRLREDAQLRVNRGQKALLEDPKLQVPF